MTFSIPYPITYQIGIFQGSQNNWSMLTKDAYAIYLSFGKNVFYLKDAHVMIPCDHSPLCKVVC